MTAKSKELVFDANQVDKRFGWVSLSRSQEDYFNIHLAATTIAEPGAIFPLTMDVDLSDEKVALSSLTGFKDTFALHTKIYGGEKGNFLDKDNVKLDWRIGGSVLSDILVAGDLESSPENILASRKILSKPSAIMPNLKHVMELEGLADYYPSIYYTANLLIGYGAYRDNAGRERIREPLLETKLSKILMPDASMLYITDSQLRIIAELRKNLAEQSRQNLKMQDQLFNHQDDRLSLYEVFEKSRLEANKREKAVIKLAKFSLLNFGGVYLPSGSFRDQEYILDASKDRPFEAYGKQQFAIQIGNLEAVNDDLRSELSELKKRDQYAASGGKLLELLGKFEKVMY